MRRRVIPGSKCCGNRKFSNTISEHCKYGDGLDRVPTGVKIQILDLDGSDLIQNGVEIVGFFRSEAPPNLSARAKKNPKGAPGSAERENPEERKSTPRDPGGRKRWLGSANPYIGFTGYTARLLRTSRKTGRTCTLRNGLVYNTAATLQPPRGAGKAP